MPIAPTSSETAPRRRKRELRSLCTPARTRRGSGGALTLSSVGSVGLRASGSWAAMRLAAPMRVSTWAEPGAPARSPRSAVPSGITIDPSSDGWRWTEDSRPTTTYRRSPRKIAGWSSIRVTWSCSATLAPTTATRSARAEWPASGSRPPASRALTARNRPGDAAFTGSWNPVWATGSLTGTDRMRSPRRSTSDRVPAATTPLRRLDAGLGVPRQGVAGGSPSGGGGLGGDDDVGGGERVEAAHDLVAGGLRQAEGGDQRGDTHDGAECGEHRPAGAGGEAGQRLRRAGRP